MRRSRERKFWFDLIMFVFWKTARLLAGFLLRARELSYVLSIVRLRACVFDFVFCFDSLAFFLRHKSAILLMIS